MPSLQPLHHFLIASELHFPNLRPHHTSINNVPRRKADSRWDISHGPRYRLLCALPAKVGENCKLLSNPLLTIPPKMLAQSPF